MKKIKYILFAFIACLMASCMDGGYDEPTESHYGNEAITETNVISIADLKTKFTTTIFNSTNSLEQMDEDIQIKGRVVGNDMGGNIYNEVALDDGTGSILICIAQGGLFGYLPIGQEILVNLKGLYIGGYGQQPEIGTPYTNKSGNTYISRMNRYLWQDHFKLIGTADATKVVAEVFDQTKMNDADYLKANCGKLMTIKNVKMKDADGKKTFAPEEEKDAANCVSRAVDGFSTSNLVVRTSTYADFAAAALPTETVSITGIFTRYRNVWQILIRTDKDIVTAGK